MTTIHDAKDQARQIRASLADTGTPISHAQALERVAHLHGFRDWNTCAAALADQPPHGWVKDGRVRGHYLGQPFEATVLSATQIRPGWYQLELALDVAVDVVTFDSFSNLRKRVRAVVGPGGTSEAKTSDGRPHLILDR
ncbi:glyoxalase superfamily protein [Pseudoruegeria sp. SK021]|uniref:glyoxalase superfamily protein n=1 Tax=Pseudoruegeria sp. SK021 TaxID=1933035 RepID=UPI000A2344A2|nr:glyoxalase superfamily protein [Pseudoruegeria sp. SK021]OSP55886.1 hypothetical protein BV911_05825 [Pseudoruegeria sp. SK021]